MKVRAKFTCRLVTDDQGGNGKHVTLTAVYAEEGDNASWSEATPSGELTMHISNPAAHKAFEQGREYYLDIMPVESDGE